MVKKLKNKIIEKFSSPKNALKSMIFILIPLMIFFSILSDRIPYNYFAFLLYGIASILILVYSLIYHRLIFDVLMQFFVLFLSAILISQLLNFKLLEFPRTIFLLSAFAVIFYQFIVTLDAKEKQMIFQLMIFGGGIFIVYFVIYYFRDLINLDFSVRLGRDFSDQNDLAKNLALFGIIAEVLAYKAKGKKRIFYFVVSGIFFFFILVTGSVSNLLVFTIISIIIIRKYLGEEKRLWFIVGLVATVALIVVIFQLPFMNYFKTRISNMFNLLFANNYSVDFSFIERIRLLYYGLKLFISKPIFGYGYDQVQYYTLGKNAFSHNNFVELLASFGLFGFLIFEAIMLYPLIKNWKKENKEQIIFTLSYLFVFQFFLITYRKKIEYFLIPLAFSLIEHPLHRGLSIEFINRKLKIKKFIEYGDNMIPVDYHSISI
ncbi:MAG: O-antigen ligase family protein [Bacilli bacterium]